MGQLDASIVTLALPRLGRDLHAASGAVEWVALAYMLVLVATVATVGRIADAIGRKLLYVYGFGVFIVGSLFCGLAPTLPILIGARVLQAVGAALLQANSVALITEALPPAQLRRGIGVQGTAQALGLALGPALGGALLALGGWRLIFFVNLPVGMLGMGLGWIMLPRSRSRRPLGRRDHLGAVLLAAAAGGPLVFVSLAGRLGYGNALLLAALAAGVAAAVGFVRHERRVPAPLINTSLFRRRVFAVGLGSGLISYVVLFGTLVVIPYFLAAHHTHAALVGLELSALPVAIAIAASIAGRFADRMSSQMLSSGAMLLTGVGLLEMVCRHDTGGLVTGLVITGLGLGTFTPTNNATIMAASPAGHAGVVSGVLNMTRGMGAALGVAIAGALYALGAGAGTAGPDPARGLVVAIGLLAALAFLTGLSVLGGSRPVLQGEQSRRTAWVRQLRRRWRSRRLSGHAGGMAATDVGSVRLLLARDWTRASAMSLLLAAIAGLRAGTARPPWGSADLLVGVYFVVLSLAFWACAARVRRAPADDRSGAVRRLALALGIGAVLILVDVATTVGA